MKISGITINGNLIGQVLIGIFIGLSRPKIGLHKKV
jgi:hypothetical protein